MGWLAVVAAAGRLELPPPVVGGDTARRAAEDVLSEPAYERAQPGPLVRLLSWLFERLDDLIGSLRAGGLASVVGWLLIAGLVAGSAAVAVRATRHLDRDRVREPDPVEGPDPERWRAEAAAARSRGDHGDAVVFEHRAVVAEMERRRLLERRSGRTVGELRALITEAVPVASPDVAELTAVFERARYGGGVEGPDAERASMLRARIEERLP